MKEEWRPVTVTFVVALLLAACGVPGGAGSGTGRETTGEPESGLGEAAKVDHRSYPGSSEGMTSGMLTENGGYSDERFIDTMAAHHRGAVEMARAALKNAGRQEVKDLARRVISGQKREIEQLKRIKQKEFGASGVPMRAMGAGDLEMLADKRPFDRAFLDAMIAHHRSAIEMAQLAFEESDDPEVRALARNVIDAQTREIRQMRQWRQQWYPEG